MLIEEKAIISLIRFTVKRKSRAEHKYVISAALDIAIQGSLL